MQIKTNIHHTKSIKVRRRPVRGVRADGPYEIWEVTITTKDGDDYTVTAFTDSGSKVSLKVDIEAE